ncbi:MAG: rod shape-determining protein RodA [Burkholderiales bacterium]
MFKRAWELLSDHIDAPLFAATCLLIALGLVVLYSASGQSMVRVNGQLINIAVALAAMWIAANIPPHYLERLAVPMYVFGVVLLLMVALFGEVANGARRWLDLGFARVQPSELMKIALPLMLAWYFDKHEQSIKLRHHAVAAVLLVVPVAFILKQPDLGTAVLVCAAGLYVLFLAKLSWRLIAGAAIVVAASLPFAWSYMHDYQQRRILTLLDPSQDPLGAGYHTIQSSIAVGSGGVSGKGWMQGTQSQLDFLPERTTDFIFAVYSEEFGLIGNLVLLLLYLLVIARGLYISFMAPSTFSRLLAASITLIFFTYAFVNMGMVSAILPVVGVPLPLVSYGGTSLVTILLGFGILMSIRTHRKRKSDLE